MRGKYITRFILFLFAYIPIYLIVALKSFNLTVLYYQGHISSVYHIVKHNFTAASLLILTFILLVYFKCFELIVLKVKGNPKFEIKSIDSQNKEYITYLGTYILPFISLETKTILDISAYVVLFLTIGMIYIRTNLIYTNPMLLFFKYDLYEVVDVEGNKIVCISKDQFIIGDKPKGISLGDKTYIIKKWTKEN